MNANNEISASWGLTHSHIPPQPIGDISPQHTFVDGLSTVQEKVGYEIPWLLVTPCRLHALVIFGAMITISVPFLLLKTRLLVVGLQYASSVW